MPTITVTKNYSDGNILTEDQLDDAFESLETALNSTKLDSDNIQTGGIVAASLASDSVTTAKIADLNVTTAKINDGAVTNVKLAALNYAISSSSGTYSSTDTNTDVAVTNLSVSLTTTGRPVMLMIVPEDAGSVGSRIGSSGGTGDNLAFKRNTSTTVARHAVNSTDNDRTGVSAYAAFDAPAAGTYTYTVHHTVTPLSSGIATFTRVRLLAYEL